MPPSIFSKLMTSAFPFSSAMRNRSGTRSIAMTRPAPSIQALWMQNCPTGPQPQTATVSPAAISAFSAAMYPVVKMSEKEHLLVTERIVLDFEWTHIGERHA
jgi:hypothetical protein